MKIHIGHRVRRSLTVLAAVALGLTSATAAPLSAAPRPATTAQVRAVPQDAYVAYGRWMAEDWPQERKWYTIDDRNCYAGGRFRNFEGHLPADGDYYEYDIHCYTTVPPPGGRGPERIVVDMDSTPPRGYYTGDHYRTFEPL
ncbi:guanyl-specific ribonuclease Sa [Saccharothrix saharensis]|uniref:Guanyl-specific ribonuclease Sa n=1 Tax=Saccharothrix saharensis TaxID=571190 RepID=A0A543JNP5_9PSEU|nr:ribonuclease domain-containing protein [Saccharothrix saharensis]TQM84462.1 guanyl-specific ribonuclease Sa [Saccharothrix saharensis]